MSNADLIERLRTAAIYGPIPCPVCDEAADALTAADKRIAELEKYGRVQDPLADRIAELEKEAQFNFEQYQDAGRLLCETNEKLAVAREALKYHMEQTRPIQKTIEALAQIGGDDAGN